MVSESLADNINPEWMPITPAAIGATCWPRTTSGVPKRLKQAVIDHCLGAGAELLSGLEHDHQTAGIVLAVDGQLFRGTQQAGYVNVMSARVHDRNIGAEPISGPATARIFQPSLLQERQGVHLDFRTFPGVRNTQSLNQKTKRGV